jgi:hypothetical protein
LIQVGKVRASLGAILLTQRAILKKKKMWMDWLDYLNLPHGTADNWIRLHMEAKACLPGSFYERTLGVGIDKVNPAYVAMFPPKERASEAEAAEWLRQMKQYSRKHKDRVTVSPEMRQQIAVNYVRSVADKTLPELTAKQAQSWWLGLLGMMLSLAGIQSEVSVKPVPVPPRPKRGAPTLVERKKRAA